MTDDFEAPGPEENRKRLVLLRPRDTQKASARSITYSRFVGILRWVLPLFALAGLISLMLWPMIRAHKLSSIVVEAVPNLMVDKLRLTGLDERNRAYSLTATRALQATGTDDRNIVDLEQPEAEIALEGGSWLAGRATKGRLNQAERKLWLGGGAEFFHDDGYRFLSDEVQVDWARSVAWGEKPVLIQGPFGEVRGEGFRILDGGKVLVVTGKATARLDLQRPSRSGKLSGKDSTSR